MSFEVRHKNDDKIKYIDEVLEMLLMNIKDITLEHAMELSKQGLNFIIRDGILKGFTK